MSASVRLTIGVALFGLMTACSGAAAPTLGPADIQATANVLLTASSPAPTATPPEPTAVPGPSFEAATYRDPSAGFEFDYPSSWTVGPVEQYSRGGITAFTSWSRSTDIFPNETPPGETRMDATVQLWDPTGDLNAFVAQRRPAWDASGISVLAEESLTLSDGRPAAEFVVQGADGPQALFFFTTISDKYLVLSGVGDLALLAEVARTVRSIEVTY